MSEPTGRDPHRADIGRRVDLLTRDFNIDTLVAVRHDVEHCAAQNGLTDLALYRFVVAVNELTTNAVRHGGGSGHLTLWRTDNRLHCRVTDRGPGIPIHHEIHQPPTDAIGGRGLWLARHSVERLTIDSHAEGTSVTGSVRL